MSQGVRDKVVVITGASSGLGEAAARKLAKEGAKLVLGARRIDRLTAFAQELSLGSDAVVQTDVSKADQVQRLVDRAVETHGRLDVILNNAGFMPPFAARTAQDRGLGSHDRCQYQERVYGIAAALPHMARP